MKPGPKINPGAGSAPRSQIFASPVLVASSPGEIAVVGGGGGGGGEWLSRPDGDTCTASFGFVELG